MVLMCTHKFQQNSSVFSIVLRKAFYSSAVIPQNHTVLYTRPKCMLLILPFGSYSEEINSIICLGNVEITHNCIMTVLDSSECLTIGRCLKLL